MAGCSNSLTWPRGLIQLGRWVRKGKLTCMFQKSDEGGREVEAPLGWQATLGSLAWCSRHRQKEIWVGEGKLTRVVQESDADGGEVAEEWRSP